MEVGVGIHQLGRDRIKPLWRLPVALIKLRPEIARPPADRIGFQDLETAGRVLLPDFELRLFLEKTQHDRRRFRHLLLFEQREQLGGQLLRCLGRQRFCALAKARNRRQRRGNSRPQYKSTSDRRADHCCPSSASARAPTSRTRQTPSLPRPTSAPTPPRSPETSRPASPARCFS